MLNNGVCVKTCPTNNTDDKVECKPTTSMAANNKYRDCVYYPSRNSVSWGPAFRYESKNFQGSFCIPKANDYVDENTYQAFKSAFFGSVYGETAGVWAYNIMKAW